MTHADQAVRGLRQPRGVEADAVVLHGDFGVVGVVLHPHDHLGGIGVLADVGQRLLHHAVDGQFADFVEFDRFERCLYFDARAVRKLARQDLERRHQPQVGQRGRAQVFDDAALERNALVERLGQVFQALGQFVCVFGQLGFDAGHVQLGGGQQRAEFVVQLARQMGAFVFHRLLQISGQLGQAGSALAHLRFKRVALGFKQLFLARIGLAQRARLVDVQKESKERCQNAGSQPEARHVQQPIQLGAVGGNHRVCLRQQRIALQLKRAHLLQPHVRGHDEIHHLGPLFLAQSHRQCHLADLLRQQVAEGLHRFALVHGARHVGAQALEQHVDVLQGRVVGRQVGAIAGEDETALARLGLDQPAHHGVDGRARGVAVLDLHQRLRGAVVRVLVQPHDGDDAQGGDDQRHARRQRLAGALGVVLNRGAWIEHVSGN